MRNEIKNLKPVWRQFIAAGCYTETGVSDGQEDNAESSAVASRGAWLAFSGVGPVSPARLLVAPVIPAWAQPGLQVPGPQGLTAVMKGCNAAALKPE